MENYSTFVSEHLDQDVLPHSHKPTKSIDGEYLGRLCRLYFGCSESICQIISSSPSIERLQRPRSKVQGSEGLECHDLLCIASLI